MCCPHCGHRVGISQHPPSPPPVSGLWDFDSLPQGDSPMAGAGECAGSGRSGVTALSRSRSRSLRGRLQRASGSHFRGHRRAAAHQPAGLPGTPSCPFMSSRETLTPQRSHDSGSVLWSITSTKPSTCCCRTPPPVFLTGAGKWNRPLSGDTAVTPGLTLTVCRRGDGAQLPGSGVGSAQLRIRSPAPESASVP